MSGNLTRIEPVLKSVTVAATPRRAFELFTAHMGEWWPLVTHSVGAESAIGVVFGEGVGGRIVETRADGSTSVWGTVTDWDPPHRVMFSWHAGTPDTEATRVEVTFTAAGPDSTVVWLEHSGWEARPHGQAARDGYESGWQPVIERFSEAAEGLHR